MSKPLSKELQVKTFDYKDIDPEVKSKLIWLSGEINRSTNAHIESAIEMGRAISDAHEILAGAGRDGLFVPWLEMECGISKSSGYRYMLAAQRFKDSQALGLFTCEAMYALSAADVPVAASKEAEKRSSKGVRITVGVAKEILGKFRETSSRAASNGKPGVEKKPAKPAAETTKPAPSKPAIFDPPPFEEPVPEPTADELMAAWNRQVESFARSITAMSDTAPKGAWWDETQANIVAQQLKSAAGAARQVKCSNLCPLCAGEGCKRCMGTGFMPKRTFEMAGK